jgi:hypothetical protein
MSCFRYVTPALRGRWRPTREEALSDALLAGQAYMQEGQVVLFKFTWIEEGPDNRLHSDSSGPE